jgi:hypothetical protein
MNHVFHKQKGGGGEAVCIPRCKQLYIYMEISPQEGGRGCEKKCANVQTVTHECENSGPKRVEPVRKCAKVQMVAYECENSIHKKTELVRNIVPQCKQLHTNTKNMAH